MILKTAIDPRKARKYSGKYQAVRRHPTGEWPHQYSILIYFLSFADELIFLG